MYEDKLPPKSEIFKYWKNRIFSYGLFIDWGEPSCWVCGFHYGSKYDIKRSDASWDEIYRCWDKMPLQRCHIVPKSLGGKDKAKNLFLMCRECHDLAPNTNIPSIFFKWAKSQSWTVRDNKKVEDALKIFGISKHAYGEFLNVMNSKDFKVWSENKMGIHWPQNKYASRVYRLTPSTTVGLIKHYMDNELKKD